MDKYLSNCKYQKANLGMETIMNGLLSIAAMIFAINTANATFKQDGHSSNLAKILANNRTQAHQDNRRATQNETYIILAQYDDLRNSVLKKIDEADEITPPKNAIDAFQKIRSSQEYNSIQGKDRVELSELLNKKIQHYQELINNEQARIERDRKRQAAEKETKQKELQEAAALERARADRQRKIRDAEREAKESQQAADDAEAEIQTRQAAAVAAEKSAKVRENAHSAMMKEEEEANARIATALASKQQAAERAARANSASSNSKAIEQAAREKEAALNGEESRIKLSTQQMQNELSEKQECLVAKKVVQLEQPILADNFSKVTVEFQAGMREEGCQHIKIAYTSAEKIRRSLASCEPASAIGMNQAVEQMRTLMVQQNCGRVQ